MTKRAIRLRAGARFGRLVVTGHTARDNEGRLRYGVVCDCGEVRYKPARALRSGNTRSCGCLHRQQLSEMSASHRMTETPEYEIWQAAKARCFRPSCRDYKDYGGRGIVMCDEWRVNFPAFLSYVGQRPDPSLTLERINNDGNYEPGNVKWATRLEQAHNRRQKKRRAA